MLYRPTPAFPSLPSRFWAALVTIVASLSQGGADQRYLDGMRSEELEDLGLRRTESRDYTFFR